MVRKGCDQLWFNKMDSGDMNHIQENNNNIVDIVVEDNMDVANSKNSTGITGSSDFEPHNGIEFESHEAANMFYQEYAKSMGFTTSIKNSRRSKKTKEFIDAKYACSRYGVTPESDGVSSRRPSVKKTDCKASMHVKRRKDGKWHIHEFIKEHNHELLPALAYHFQIRKNVKLAEKNNIDILNAVSERTKKMYVEMSRQQCGHKSVAPTRFREKGRYLTLEEGDAQFMVEYFRHVQRENPNFFYAIDFNEDQRLRSFFWVDAKSRNDYDSFNDVVFFDTSYIKGSDKMPFAPFIGVNHHLQPILLGCALVSDENKSSFEWVMKSWLRAMGGNAPKLIMTDQGNALKASIQEVFPTSRHCFQLWHILEKIPEALSDVVKIHENFLRKFYKCIFKSWTDKQFDLRWWKMLARFELQDNDWILSLYDDRKMWVPVYMKNSFFAGMSTTQRAESVGCFFDKYVHKKITLREFIRQYGVILQNRYEEEAVADFDTWHKQPAVKSPSPWEKQMSTIYTHAIFKKFQVEVLGVVGCHPKKDLSEVGSDVTFRVEDCEKCDNFIVAWNEAKLEVSCSCLLFEYKGFLCRHAMIVLQLHGFSSIPSHYILKRWTKDAKNGQSISGTGNGRTRVQRYNDLCRWAIELSDEGSLSEANYKIAFRTFVDALNNCVNVNNRNAAESTCNALSLREMEEENQGHVGNRTTKRKTSNKKRKVQLEPEPVEEAHGSLPPHMDNLSSEGMTMNGFYGAQQNVPGMLNLMEPPHDGYYVSSQGIQGLGGQLSSSITPNQDGFFGTHQSVHELVHLDFRPNTSYGYGLQDDPNLRSSQMLHGCVSRHE